MKWIACKLGLHKKKHKREVVYKSKNVETVNVFVTCERCGKELNSYGFTHLGPFEFELQPPKQEDK